MRPYASTVVTALLVAAAAAAAEDELRITVAAPVATCTNLPVSVRIDLAAGMISTGA